MFKTFFAQFDGPSKVRSQSAEDFNRSQSNTAKSRDSEVSISDMHNSPSKQRRKSQIASEKLFKRDKTRELVTIWRIEKFEAVELAQVLSSRVHAAPRRSRSARVGPLSPGPNPLSSGRAHQVKSSRSPSQVSQVGGAHHLVSSSSYYLLPTTYFLLPASYLPLPTSGWRTW